MPRITRIQHYPFVPTYSTPEAAIAGAMSHPQQPQARAVTELLHSSQFIDAAWNDTNFYLRFSNANILQVFLDNDQVDWRVREDFELTTHLKRVSAEPLILDWGGKIGCRLVDYSGLIASRRGTDFHRLFVNESGLLLYLRGHDILHFGRVKNILTGSAMLYLGEME
jgi:hypothetical protein